jgi:hypothetical protein
MAGQINGNLVGFGASPGWWTLRDSMSELNTLIIAPSRSRGLSFRVLCHSDFRFLQKTISSIFRETAVSHQRRPMPSAALPRSRIN